MRRSVLSAAGAMLLGIGLAGCGGQSGPAMSNDCGEIAAVPAGERSAPVEIFDVATVPFGQFNTPDLFAEWPKTMLERMNVVRGAGAGAASYSAECDKVVATNLAEGSVAPRSFKIDVICANSRRFRVEDAEVRRPLESEQRKACRMTPDAIAAICEARLKREAKAASIAYTEKTVAMENGLWTVAASATLTLNTGSRRNVKMQCVVDSGGLVESFSGVN